MQYARLVCYIVMIVFIGASFSQNIVINSQSNEIDTTLVEKSTEELISGQSNDMNYRNQPIRIDTPLDKTSKDGLWINVTKEIEPDSINPCEPTSIFINVSVEGHPTIDYVPVYVVLVIDRSGSMEFEYDGQTALYWTKEAAKQFVGELNFSKDKVAIVSYGTQTTLEQTLTDDGNIANTSIDDITIPFDNWERGTNTGEGLRVAQEHLNGNVSAGALPIIVLFSDGCPSIHGLSNEINSDNIYEYFCGNCPVYNNTCVTYARDNADAIKDFGTTLFTVGFFDAICDVCNPPEDNCTEVTEYVEWLSQDMASDPSYFFNAPNATDIEDVFLQVSEQVNEVILTNLTISDYLPENITVLTTGGGTYTSHVNGTQEVTFSLGYLSLNQSWNNSFSITTDFIGNNILTNYVYSKFTYSKNNTQYIKYLPYPITLNSINPIYLEKTGPEEVEPNDQFNYTIKVGNNGDVILYNVTLIDELPENVSFNPISLNINSNYSGFDENNWEYYFGNHTLIISNLTVEVGDLFFIDITVEVVGTAEGTVINNVTASYTSLDGLCNAFGSSIASVSTDVITYHPNISVVKSADPNPANVGEMITYTYVVTNTGDVTLDPVSVVDDVLGVVSLNVSVLGPGEWAVGTLTYVVVEGDLPGPIVNTALATGSPPVGVDVFDSDGESVDLVSNPGISVVKSADPTSGVHSIDVTYTIVVTNTGDVTLNPVSLVDTLPNGMSYVSDDSSGFHVNGIVNWSIGPMNPSDVVTIQCIANVDDDASGTIINVVNVTGLPPVGEPVNDSDIADFTVITSNIKVIKSVKYNCNGPYSDEGIVIDLNGPNAYDWCTFRINVTNNNDAPANITIKDSLPDGIIDGNHYKPRDPDFIDGNDLYWYYDGVYGPLVNPNETISIWMRADMGECDIQYLNYAYVTSQVGTSPPIVDVDTAYIKWINCDVEYPIDINQSVFDRGFPIRHTWDGDWGAAQNFTPNVSIMTDASIKLRKFGTPEFNLIIELREDAIDGTLLDTIELAQSEVSSSWTWLELDFSDIPISDGIDYFIVCPPAPSGVANSFGYEWGYAFGNQYDDGSFWFTRDGGGLWRDLPNMYEYSFRTYGYS